MAVWTWSSVSSDVTVFSCTGAFDLKSQVMAENWAGKASCWLHVRVLEQNAPFLAFSLLHEKILNIQATRRDGMVRNK